MRARTAAAVLALPLLLTACGGITAITFTTTEVGRDGGAVLSEDGTLTVFVPPGTVQQPTEIRIDDQRDEDGAGTIGLEADGSFTADIELKVGENDVLVTATDLVGGAETQTVTIVRTTPAGPVQTGSVQVPGTVRVDPSVWQPDLAPRFIMGYVGDRFPVSASLRTTLDDPARLEGLGQMRPVADAGLTAELLTRGSVPGAGIGIASLAFTCAETGRWNYGFSFPDGDRRVEFLLGVAECFDPADLFRDLGGLGVDVPPATPVTTPSEPPAPVSPPPANATGPLGALEGSPAVGMPDDKRFAVRVLPTEVTATVGDGFFATLDLWDGSSRARPGSTTTYAYQGATEGAGVLTAGTGNILVQVPEGGRRMGLPLYFTCAKAGSERFGVAAQQPGDSAPSEHLLGSARCENRGATPTPEQAVTTFPSIGSGATWAPGAQKLPDGTSVTLTPPAFTASPGQTVQVGVTVDPGSPAPPGWKLLEATPIVGDGEVLRPGPAVQPDMFGELTLPFTCIGSGIQSYGVRVRTIRDADPNDPKVTPDEFEFGKVEEHGLLLGTALCAEGMSTGIPDSWIRTITGGKDGSGATRLGPTLKGPCQGRAAIDGYTTIDPGASGGVYTVPRSGSAQWEGSIQAPEGQERSHSGAVKLHLPPPLSPITIGEPWSGTGTETRKSGNTSWNLDPRITPAGPLFAVTGEHKDTAGHCSAAVLVRFDGDFTDSPIGPGALALTLFALGIFGWAGVPKP